jgi:hypothetical protein
MIIDSLRDWIPGSWGPEWIWCLNLDMSTPTVRSDHKMWMHEHWNSWHSDIYLHSSSCSPSHELIMKLVQQVQHFYWHTTYAKFISSSKTRLLPHAYGWTSDQAWYSCHQQAHDLSLICIPSHHLAYSYVVYHFEPPTWCTCGGIQTGHRCSLVLIVFPRVGNSATSV